MQPTHASSPGRAFGGRAGLILEHVQSGCFKKGTSAQEEQTHLARGSCCDANKVLHKSTASLAYLHRRGVYRSRWKGQKVPAQRMPHAEIECADFHVFECTELKRDNAEVLTIMGKCPCCHMSHRNYKGPESRVFRQLGTRWCVCVWRQPVQSIALAHAQVSHAVSCKLEAVFKFYVPTVASSSQE